MNPVDKLYELQDENYADFNSKLIPNVPREKIIGVRIPDARKLAKQMVQDDVCENFLDNLPHNYFDENILHAIIISQCKDYKKCIELCEDFLPYVDNWAVCDILSPKIFKKNRDKLIFSIKKWASSKETYTCRFGIGMLMAHFLDEDFDPKYLKMVAEIHSDEYYVNMMIAWFFATALAKKWDYAIEYLKDKNLDKFTHNKSIQKACESRRITNEQKLYLKGLKVK